jgi:phosphoribosylformylglycinamidine cyclo-ligase
MNRKITKLTYKNSGVDIKKAKVFKRQIKALVRKSFSSAVLKDIGGFGSFFSLETKKYREPILVSSADGVGTKLKIAVLAKRHYAIGIDVVGMNVNDILCTGAQPLFFLDYLSCAKLQAAVLYDVVKGINDGCIQAGCSLIGGETAQMPGMYIGGDYDVAGFCVGIVEKKRIIDGSNIQEGDCVIGLASNGLHANGYSLVRKVFSRTELVRMNEELLRPTRIYVKPVLSALSKFNSREKVVRGIAHITGGAFYDKITRIIPDHLDVIIQKGSWPVPKIFQLIQNKGNIDDKEMYHTLNMGIGMVLVVSPQATNGVIATLKASRVESWMIGRVVKGNQQVLIP